MLGHFLAMSASSATLKGYWEFDNSAAIGQGKTLPGGGTSPTLVVQGTAPTYSATLADDGSVKTLSGVIKTVTGTANRLSLTHGISPNGGGLYVNNYTLMFDVFSPTTSRSSWRSFYQTNAANTNDAEYFIRNSDDKLGTAALVYSSTALDEAHWKRVVISVTLGTNIKTYVDGVLWATHTADVVVDGHNSLDPTLLLFADNNAENASLNVGAVAIWDGALTAAEVTALGSAGVALSTSSNTAPVITQGATTTLNATQDGTAVTGTLGATDAQSDPITWTVSTAAGHGTASVTSSNTSCPFRYTPTAGYFGPDSFVIQASDGTLSSLITVNVTVAPKAPQIALGAVTAINAVKNGPAVPLTLTATDAQGNPITWTIVTTATNGSAGVVSANTTGNVTYTPTADFSGTDTFTVQASDGTNSSTIKINVVVLDSAGSSQVVGLWQFDDATNRSKATVGFDLVPSGTGFTVVPGISGSDSAMEIGVGSFYRVTHGVPANGSGVRSNRYSIIWDLKIPTASATAWKNILQTTPANNDDGDLFIRNTDNAIGTAAGLGGYSTTTMTANNWYRVVLSIENGVANNVYINGAKVLTGTVSSTVGAVGGTDGRYGLLDEFLAFADNDGEDGLIDVSTMAVVNGPLSDNQVALLGTAGSPINTALPPKPAPDGLWMFNEPTKLEAATIGSRLFRNGTGFSLVSGTGSGDGAVEIAAGSNYIVNHGIAASGGGAKVNEYSVLWDVKYPTTATKALHQTDLANATDSEVKINSTGNIGHTGLGGFSSQATSAATWYRVVMVVKNGTDRSLYVNGSLWYDGNAGVVDDSYGLDPAGFLAFADDNGEDGVIDVTNLAVWGRALSIGDVLVLGNTVTAVADNITPISPNVAPVITEGDTYTLNANKDGGAQSAVLHATDANTSDVLTWSINTPASHGSVQVTGSGGTCNVAYTPESAYTGLDSFTVRVSDGWATDTIQVDVTVIDPIAPPKLTIVSAHGTATPVPGVYTNARGMALTNSVTDEATVTSRFHCTGWSMTGDGPHSGTASTMNMTLTRDSTLTWLWQTEYYLTTATSGSGTVNVATGWYQSDRPLQITATPAAGYYFVGWSGDTTGCTIGGKSIVLPMNRVYGTITANFAASQNFTVVGLPDTQNYCWITNVTDIFARQTQWVLDNKATLNIKFVTHLGDIVDSASSASQWTRAVTAMDLLNNKMPYGVCPGNHDLANGDTHYLTNFGPTHARWVDPASGQSYSWYQGTSPRGYSNYEVLNLNGRDYMFLHIDCDCPDSDMAWAATVLSQHPRTVTMLTTHDYMAETGASSSSGSGTGQRGRVNWPTGYISVGPDRNTVTDIWNTLVKPFNQVYMVICGHNFAQYNITDTNNAGKIVHQVLCDYQTLPNGGNGFLRVMEFRPSQNQIYNTTYSPYLGRYMSNTSSPSAQLTSDNTGMLDLTDKNGGEFSLTTDFDTRFNNTLTVASAQPTVTPAVGSTSIEDGTPVVVTAADRVVGSTRYKCTGWNLTGGTTASGTGTATTFTMNGATNLTWNWATEYYLDTLATGRGIVSVNSGYQTAGSTVSVIAQPDAGAAFLRWSGDTSGCTVTGNTISVPMDRGRGPVTAEFTPLVPTYTVNVVSAYANVTPAAASYPYEEGTQATFTALDLTEGGIRHVVTGWSTTGAVTQTGTGNSATIPVTGDFTFTWNWKTQYRLQTAVSGPGSVTGGGEQWIDDGASASVTATPGSGANFMGWSGDTALGSASGNVFNISSMTRAVSPLTANFMTGFHTLTVLSTQANTVPAPGTYSMAHGTTINYSATTIDNGRARYVPAGWTLSGTPETNGTTPKGSFVLNADTTLSWSWGSEVVLELASGLQGSILPSNAAGWHTLGENVTLQAVPGPKFQFSSWKGDVTGNPNLPTTTIKMSVARTIAADFTAVKAPSGTPQWWLERHAHVNGGDLTAAEQADFDGDGKTASEEFIAGMDDLDPQKVYKVTGFKLLQGATPKMELSWPAAAGRTYAIWSSPNLQPPFTLVQDNIPAIEPVTTTQVPVGAGLNRLFFKVEAKLIPGGTMDTNPPATKPEPKPGCLLREMKLIPAGEFIMGDDAGGEASSQPAHSVTVAAFFMDKFEVTLGDWKTVATWANANGYDLPVDLHVGDNPAPPLDHPTPGVSWYEAVKWCNARSEMEGRLPAYYTDTQTTTVYRTGTLDLTSANVNWAGNGYRLPTESEWEKACRGGLAGKTYSWGNETQTNRANGWLFQLAIDHTQAPYPLSTPVGYFNGSQVVPGGGPDMANGYGLYDMSGNAWEWCWDRFGDYDKPALFDPKGPDTGDRRLSRGGSWWNNETDLTNAHRYPFPPVGENVYGQIGFRAIRSAGPNEAP
jgi:formylglycine-generating enzyme required for sulfatase activity